MRNLNSLSPENFQKLQSYLLVSGQNRAKTRTFPRACLFTRPSCHWDPASNKLTNFLILLSNIPLYIKYTISLMLHYSSKMSLHHGLATIINFVNSVCILKHADFSNIQNSLGTYLFYNV